MQRWEGVQPRRRGRGGRERKEAGGGGQRGPGVGVHQGTGGAAAHLVPERPQAVESRCGPVRCPARVIPREALEHLQAPAPRGPGARVAPAGAPRARGRPAGPRPAQPALERPPKLDRLARELVQRFTVPVAPAGGEGAEDACCVCLEPLERDLRMLPCGHRLHGACMRRWLWGKPRCVCPLCKRMAG